MRCPKHVPWKCRGLAVFALWGTLWYFFQKMIPNTNGATGGH